MLCFPFRVSGTPILWGWDKLSLQGLIWTPTQSGQPEKAIAVGMVIENIRLDHLMEKIFGKSLFASAWFSDMTASKYCNEALTVVTLGVLSRCFLSKKLAYNAVIFDRSSFSHTTL